MGDFDFFELSFFFDSRSFLSTLSFDLERLGGDLERDLLEREAFYSSLIVVCDLSLGDLGEGDFLRMRLREQESERPLDLDLLLLLRRLLLLLLFSCLANRSKGSSYSALIRLLQ